MPRTASRLALLSAGIVLAASLPGLAQDGGVVPVATTTSTSTSSTTVGSSSGRALPAWWAERCGKARNHGEFVRSVPVELRSQAAKSDCGKPKAKGSTSTSSTTVSGARTATSAPLSTTTSTLASTGAAPATSAKPGKGGGRPENPGGGKGKKG